MRFHFTKFFMITSIFLSSFSSFSQESLNPPSIDDKPSPLPEEPPSSPNNGPQVLPTPEPDASNPQISAPPTFQPVQMPQYQIRRFRPVRIGLELSIIPFHPIWNGENNEGYFTGGVDAKFLVRLHPRIAFELAGTLARNGQIDSLGKNLIDPSITVGTRIYLHRNPHILLPTRLVPYFVGVIGIDFARLLDNSYHVLDESNYVMYQLGGGFEWRFAHEQVALTADLRFVGQNRLDSNAHWVNSISLDELFSPTRYGLRGAFGFSFFFN